MRKLVFLAIAAALPLPDSASARLVAFDLIKSHGLTYGEIPSGWASFDWSADFYWMNPAEEAPGTGYQYGMVSSPNVAFNAAGGDVSFRRNTAFQLVSFDLAGAWRNGLEVTVTGFSKACRSTARRSQSTPRARRWKP